MCAAKLVRLEETFAASSTLITIHSKSAIIGKIDGSHLVYFTATLKLKVILPSVTRDGPFSYAVIPMGTP